MAQKRLIGMQLSRKKLPEPFTHLIRNTMKKTIKLTAAQRNMVTENIGKFKGEILSKITHDILDAEGGEEGGPYTRYIRAADPWIKKG
jgi:hypothetical protein